MYIVVKDGGLIYPDEPQLGSLPDEIVIVEEELNEALILLLEYLSDNQEVPVHFYATDSLSNEVIELETKDYLTIKQIQFLTDIFDKVDGFTLLQIEAILDAV